MVRDLVARLVIRAQNEASTALDSVRGTIVAIGAAITTYFGARAFRDVVNSAAEFELAMSGVQAITRSVGEDFTRLQSRARELGSTTSFSAREAAEGMQYLGMAGFNTAQIVAALPDTLAMARAGALELGAAADIASNALSGFGLAAEDMGRVADTMAAAAALSNTSVQQLGEAFSYAAPLSKELAIDIELAAAAIGKLSDAGLQGSRAGTGLAGVLRQLTNVTSAGQGVLQQYGLALSDVDVKSRGLDNVLRSLADAGLSAGDTMKLFGAEAGVAAQILLGTSAEVSNLADELRDAEGAAKAMADVMSDNLFGDLDQLRSALSEINLAGQELGNVTERLRSLTQTGTTFAQRFGEGLGLMSESIRETRGELEQLADDESIQNWADDAVRYFAIAADAGRAAGFTIKETLTAIGETAAAGAAQAVALARGNFAEVSAIGDAWLADMEARKNRALEFDAELYRSAAREIEQRRQQRAEIKELDRQLEEAAAQFDQLNDRTNDSVETFKSLASSSAALREAFATLGMDAASALGGISDGAQEAIDAIDTIVSALEDAEVSTTQAASAIEAALASAFDVADSLPALDALNDKMRELGASGKIGADALDRLATAADAARRRIEDITPGIQSVEEAFRRLGVTSQRELDAAAREAKAAFDVIRASGEATGDELRQAFAAYASAAVAATGGVVDAALQGEAAMQGLRVEADEAGRVIVKSMLEAAAATREVADAADTAKGALDDVADGADNVARSAGASAGAIRNHRIELLHAADAASQYAGEAERMAQSMMQSAPLFGRGLTVAIESARDAAAHYIRTLEALDQRQQSIHSNASQGVEDLEFRLLQLNGTEEQIAAAQRARDEARVRQQIELTRIEIERARLRAEDAEAARLREEIALYERQLQLIGQIHREEQRQRGNGGTGGGGGGGGTGRRSGGMSEPTHPAPRGGDTHIHIGGVLDVNDRATLDNLARKLAPVLGDNARKGV